MNYAKFLAEEGHRALAEEQYRTVINLCRHHAEAHYRLGQLLLTANQPDSAEFQFRETLRIAPDWADAHMGLADAFGAKGLEIYLSEFDVNDEALPDAIGARDARVAATGASYLRAALSNGLQVKRCEEPSVARASEPLPEPATEIGDWKDWPFSLTDYLPSVARAADNRPHLVIWHFQLPAA